MNNIGTITIGNESFTAWVNTSLDAGKLLQKTAIQQKVKEATQGIFTEIAKWGDSVTDYTVTYNRNSSLPYKVMKNGDIYSNENTGKLSEKVDVIAKQLFDYTGIWNLSTTTQVKKSDQKEERQEKVEEDNQQNFSVRTNNFLYNLFFGNKK